MSKKRHSEKGIYDRERVKYLKANRSCTIQSPICTHKATVIHHKRGREGHRYLNQAEWAASCVACNLYVEKEKAWAVANGHRLDRLAA